MPGVGEEACREAGVEGMSLALCCQLKRPALADCFRACAGCTRAEDHLQPACSTLCVGLPNRHTLFCLNRVCLCRALDQGVCQAAK